MVGESDLKEDKVVSVYTAARQQPGLLSRKKCTIIGKVAINCSALAKSSSQRVIVSFAISVSNSQFGFFFVLLVLK
jgi:hypothetical protein